MTTRSGSGGSAQPGPSEEDRRRLREALERKKGVQHPDDTARGGSSAHGRPAGPTRREFRRKSG